MSKETGLMRTRPTPFATIASLMAIFVLSGTFIQLLPVSAPAIIADWGLPDTAMALPIAAVLIGSGLGAVSGGVIADNFGRRFLIGASLLMLGLFEALATFASTPLQLFVPVLLAGVAMGCFFAASMALLTELVPFERRALAISFSVASLPTGLSIAALASAAILPEFGWQALFRLFALLSIPVFICFVIFVPESPNFLVKIPARSAELKRITERLGISHEPREAPAAAGEEEPFHKRFVQLLHANPGATLGIWGLFFATYIFGNAVLNWVPVALSRLGYPLSFASGALTAWTIASIVGTPLAGWLLGRFGLHRVAPLGAAITVIVSAVLAYTSAGSRLSEPVLLSILAFGGIGSAAIVTALYTLVAEIYPPNLRASGVGTSDAIGRIGGVLAAVGGVHLVALAGVSAFFLFLAILMAFVTIAMLAMPGKRHGAAAPAE